MKTAWVLCLLGSLYCAAAVLGAEQASRPYSAPCTEREELFEFTQKPTVKGVGQDRYEIAFAVKGKCDVTVEVVDGGGAVVRHLASGVLGENAPAPFERKSLSQTLYWNGKDDLDAYVKDPGACRIRVRLGLKPEFDKLLADYGPHNLPDLVAGIAVGEEGAFVLAKACGTFGHMIVRHFDHDGKYVAQLVPPPANLPESRLGGMGYVEYEPGVRALHGPAIAAVDREAWVMPNTVNGKYVGNCQPALVGRRIYYPNGGAIPGNPVPSLLHWLGTDGSTEPQGVAGLPFAPERTPHRFPRLAASPDGRRLYLSGICEGGDGKGHPYVMVKELERPEAARVFVGKQEPGKGCVPASDNEGFNGPWGIDCDAQGRVYVADNMNGRLQIFAPDGKWLKTVPIDRPRLVRVHRKSGAFYVTHGVRVQGETIGRLTKFKSFDDPAEAWHLDYPGQVPTPAVMAVDEWTARPRLWLAGGGVLINVHISGGGPSVRLYEDDGQAPRLLADFEEIARKQSGGGLWMGRWQERHVGGSGIAGKVICDPVRERAYFNQYIFDLKSGALLGKLHLKGCIDDIAFDRRGYLHEHFNPGFYLPGVGREDPGQARKVDEHTFSYPEVPYDYGEDREKHGWRGILPVKDQEGPMYFQDGLGVNMQGEVAEICNIFYLPKAGEDDFWAGMGQQGRPQEGYADHYGQIGKFRSYAEMLRKVDEQAKAGESTYFINRQPGIPLSGGTIWTFERTGELRKECAVIAGSRINGVQMDEEGALYFVANRTRLLGGLGFLKGRWGHFGGATGKEQPFTGTLMKTKKGQSCRLLARNAPIPMDQPPQRPAELESYRATLWAEGAEWLYAGASPIVAGGCVCPTQRLHLDWHRRTYLPEGYRHSVGVLDSAGNLILHLGRYGNYDSGFGAQSRIPVGGDQIAFFTPRFISGTDQALVVADWDERLVVLRLSYHAEESVGVR